MSIPFSLIKHRGIEVGPSFEVIRGFGLEGEPIPLEGGEGTSFIVQNVVLKPSLDILESELCSQIMASITHASGHTFRIPEPIRGTDGNYVSFGWTAARYVSGSDKLRGRWEELLHTSIGFHKALAAFPQPPFLHSRTHVWNIADKVAWGEESIEIYHSFQHNYKELVNLRKEVQVTCQLIHGDLTGNVLFHDTLPPAIIDFSPYWRPYEYANAIIVADGLLDYGQSDELVLLWGTSWFHFQMLIRALLFRLVAESQLVPRRGISDAAVERYNHALRIVQSAKIWDENLPERTKNL